MGPERKKLRERKSFFFFMLNKIEIAFTNILYNKITRQIAAPVPGTSCTICLHLLLFLERK
jgi:hypothetical protein